MFHRGKRCYAGLEWHRWVNDETIFMLQKWLTVIWMQLHITHRNFSKQKAIIRRCRILNCRNWAFHISPDIIMGWCHSILTWLMTMFKPTWHNLSFPGTLFVCDFGFVKNGIKTHNIYVSLWIAAPSVTKEQKLPLIAGVLNGTNGPQNALFRSA